MAGSVRKLMLRSVKSSGRWSSLNTALSTSSVMREDATLKAEESPAYFRTSESCPTRHDDRHLGRIFTLEDGLAEVLGPGPDRNTLGSKAMMDQMETFGEQSWLVRRPMLEITQYIRQAKTRAGNSAKFVLWGEYGNGKTTTLSYAAGFCHLEGYIVCNFYQFRNWITNYQEMQVSERNPNRFDHVTRSQTFLKEFLIYNQNKIQHLKTHQTYEWSEREKSEAGSPLSDVINTGIERPKFAGDCVGVLLKELRLHCQDAVDQGDPDRCRVATVVDGVGIIFQAKTLMNRQFPADEKIGPLFPEYIEDSVAPDELSIVLNLKKMLKGDYPNAVVLTTVDEKDETYLRKMTAFKFDRIKSMRPELQAHTPFALLRQEGWELLNPFVPVQIGRYTKSEMDVMIDYYLDRKYIQDVSGTEAGRAETHFLTGRHPKDFMQLSRWI